MSARIQPLWLFGIPLLALSAYIGVLVIPIVRSEVVPVVVRSAMASW